MRPYIKLMRRVGEQDWQIRFIDQDDKDVTLHGLTQEAAFRLAEIEAATCEEWTQAALDLAATKDSPATRNISEVLNKKALEAAFIQKMLERERLKTIEAVEKIKKERM